MKHILIIEDNFDVRENLAEILELSGYQVSSGENGKIGVQLAKECKPDLIICDVMMPELDGFGVLKILNNDPRLMHIPFMFLTAKAEKNDFRKGMGLGADDYITKPFDDVELLDAIEMRLKKSEKLKALDNSDDGLKQLFSEAKAEAEFQKLSEDRETRKYNKKDLIYETSQYPKWLFFIISGQVKCYKTNDFGKELITHLYGPGEFFGFIPLLSDHTYEESCCATEDTVVRLIPKEDFKLLLFNNRHFSAKFINMLANHADHTERQLIDLAYSSVRKKVANALITLSEKYQSDTIKVMRDDLAQMAGTAKETVIRTLSDFKAEGLIKVDDAGIEILEKNDLALMPQ